MEGGAYRLHGNIVLTNHVYKQTKSVTAANGLTGFPWGKVFRGSIFQTLKFPEGFWFEDSINSFLIYPQAKNVYVIDTMVYYYRSNPNSITSTFQKRKKCIDTYWITEKLMEDHKRLNLPVNQRYYEKLLRQILLNAKRVCAMEEKVQKSVFVLSCDLIKQEFPEKQASKIHPILAEALYSNDYGKYKLYCKTH